YREALNLNPQSAEAHYGIGVALRGMRKPAEAADEFRAALRVNPRHPGAQYELGTLLFADEHLDEAAEHLERATELQSDNADAYLVIGKVYRQQGKDADAERALNAALMKNPDFSPALYELAMLSKKRGDNEQAAVYLKRVRAHHQREVSSGEANAENSKGISQM